MRQKEMKDEDENENNIRYYYPYEALNLLAPIPNFQTPTGGTPCFKTQEFSFTQETIDLQIGLKYQMTENLNVNLLIGRSNSETERDSFRPHEYTKTEVLTGLYVEETDQDNLSYSVNMDYQHSARVSTSLKASQNQEQTADGLSVDKNPGPKNIGTSDKVNTDLLQVFAAEYHAAFKNGFQVHPYLN